MTTTLPTQIIISTCECKQCKHLWPTRIAGRLPLICPKCRSIWWNSVVKVTPKKERARVQELVAKLKEQETLK